MNDAFMFDIYPWFLYILKFKFSHSKLFFIKFPLGILFTTLQGYFAFKRGQRIIFLYRSLIGVKAKQYVKVVIYIYIYIFTPLFKLFPLVVKGLRVGIVPRRAIWLPLRTA